MSANELSSRSRPWSLISDFWPTNRKKPALMHKHTHIFSSVSLLVSPSLLFLQVSLLSVCTCLPIVQNWISLNDEDLSLCYHRAEPCKVLEHCSKRTHRHTKRGEGVKPSRRVKYLRGPVGRGGGVFCFCEKVKTERQTREILENFKPQKLSINSAHLGPDSIFAREQDWRQEEREGAKKGSIYLSYCYY